MPGTCLCVIFNHAFPKNIPKLRKIYEGRFDHIRFIQPCLRSDDADVITVYRGSYAHGAYVADCLDRLLDTGASRYVFVQDDVLLAPDIDQNNLNQAVGIANDEAFVSGLMSSADEDLGEWGFWPGSLWRLHQPRNLLSGTGLDSWEATKSFLPAIGDIQGKADRLGIAPKTLFRTSSTGSYPVNRVALFDGLGEDQTWAYYDATFRNLVPDGVTTLDYPLVSAGPAADFYILPRGDLPSFAHICGVLAAAGAFVEIAIGTAMAFGTNKLKLATDTGVKLLWSSDPMSLSQALSTMVDDPDVICAHPVKLSGEQEPIADQLAAYDHRKPDRNRGSLLEQALRLNPDFDGPSYLEANKDVAVAGVEPELHYILHGWREGRALRV